MIRRRTFPRGQLLLTQVLLTRRPDIAHFDRHFSTTNYDLSKNGKDSSDADDKDIKIPEPPTNCCMSGCPNCVWVEYAETISKIFKDSGEKSREIILSKVTDVNMKAFLSMELTILQRRLKDSNGNGNKNDNDKD